MSLIDFNFHLNVENEMKSANPSQILHFYSFFVVCDQNQSRIRKQLKLQISRLIEHNRVCTNIVCMDFCIRLLRYCSIICLFPFRWCCRCFVYVMYMCFFYFFSIHLSLCPNCMVNVFYLSFIAFDRFSFCARFQQLQ